MYFFHKNIFISSYLAFYSICDFTNKYYLLKLNHSFFRSFQVKAYNQREVSKITRRTFYVDKIMYISIYIKKISNSYFEVYLISLNSFSFSHCTMFVLGGWMIECLCLPASPSLTFFTPFFLPPKNLEGD